MYRLSILIPALLAACGSVPQATYETLQKDTAYRADVTTGAFVELDGGHCYYELGGPAPVESEQALLVLVHGFSVPSYIWDPTFQEAVRRGRPVLRLDLFGRGHSANPDTNYDPDLYADQIIGLLDHLEYQRPVHLIGLSMGGVVVARTAARHPARIQTLVMVDPSGFQPGYGQDLDAARHRGDCRLHQGRLPHPGRESTRRFPRLWPVRPLARALSAAAPAPGLRPRTALDDPLLAAHGRGPPAHPAGELPRAPLVGEAGRCHSSRRVPAQRARAPASGRGTRDRGVRAPAPHGAARGIRDPTLRRDPRPGLAA